MSMGIIIDGISFSKEEGDKIWNGVKNVSNYYNFDRYSLNDFFQNRNAFITTQSNLSIRVSKHDKNEIYLIHIEQDYYNNAKQQIKSTSSKIFAKFKTNEHKSLSEARIVDYCFASVTLMLIITTTHKEWSIELSPDTLEKTILSDLQIAKYRITNITSLNLNKATSPPSELFKIDLEKCWGKTT